MAAAPALDRLAASLQEVGLINPPWLRPQPGGQRFRVVTGARRLKAAADLGWQEITVRLVPGGHARFLLPAGAPYRQCLYPGVQPPGAGRPGRPAADALRPGDRGGQIPSLPGPASFPGASDAPGQDGRPGGPLAASWRLTAAWLSPPPPGWLIGTRRPGPRPGRFWIACG